MSTNLTPAFNEELKKHNARPTADPTLTLKSIDEFLKEAYRINSHIASLNTYLISIRKSYLSTAPPPRRIRTDDTHKYLTDRQRDEIDAETKQLLRELNSSIRNLADAEQIRQNTQLLKARKKYGHNMGRFAGALSSWAAGSEGAKGKGIEELEEEAREKQFGMFRESVLWYLRSKLGDCGRKQAQMMEIRIGREMEKNKSVLSKAREEAIADFGLTPGVIPAMKSTSAGRAAAMEEQRSGGSGSGLELSEEQLQLFEQENQDMLKHYEQTLNQVRTAEKSLVEISELQTQLVSNLETQSAHIEQLVADSTLTTENVGGGNKQLKKATERESTAKWVFYGSCGLCTVLVLWDLII